MAETFRLASGGRIDRSLPQQFHFDGKAYKGCRGDTLASALLANGVHFVGRSFKYHRPRGIFSAGPEEPNALVELGEGAYQEPNTRATQTELFDGLVARSQNHVGSLRHDLMAVNDWLAPWLGAGFYYKTFMWPAAFWERVYEPLIRRAAGLGRLSGQADPDCYDKGFLHCDVLIIGAGPAGLAAAMHAGEAGAQVIVAEQDFVVGGRLQADARHIEGLEGAAWAEASWAALRAMPNVRLLPRTTVFGAYDHGIYGLLEIKANPHPPRNQTPRQVLWRCYAQRALVCSGAIERPLVFGNNDRPGIMLAGAVRTYLRRFSVRPGARLGIFANNGPALAETQHAAEAAGMETVLFDLTQGQDLIDTNGRARVRDLTLANGRRERVDCLAVSGGWNPNVHLACHQRGRPRWREDIAAFVPGDVLPPGQLVAGAANGTYDTLECLNEGWDQAGRALEDLGRTPQARPTWQVEGQGEVGSHSAHLWVAGFRPRAWVDLQNDVTAKDIRIAQQEGFEAAEHLKRYTTLGMATDQGKTSNVLGLALMAELTGKSIPETGTTIYRPPSSPLTIGALAGRAVGQQFKPTRHTPSHAWAKRHGATFVETGLWLRAQWFAQDGETYWRQSVDREVRTTRSRVGICDVTTLGKIDIQGRDAAAFVNKIYANPFAKLPVGKVRYGLMLREDGLVMDDGTTARLAETHFLMTTTTANAVSVFRHLEFCRQCLWPHMDVSLISVTEQWAQFAVAGPQSRALLQKIVDSDYDIGAQAFPFMACAEMSVCGGVQARLFRVSFSGEMAYELAVPARYGEALMAALMAAGEEFGAEPYGTEALGVMRIEKGHPAGNELNGQTTALNMGLGSLTSAKKDYIGHTLARRPELARADGFRLVGLKPLQDGAMLTAGAHFIDLGNEAVAAHDLGYMTSVAYSPTLGHSIGLGYLERGNERIGAQVRAVDLVRGTDQVVEVLSPHMFDPEGRRQRD